jgi:spore maturation protein CgeB
MIAPFPRRFVFLGLSISSLWGNSHAPVYRTLLRALVARGHHVLFLERDAEWFAATRDCLKSACGEVETYSSLGDLRTRFTRDIRTASCVVVGSSIPDSAEVTQWVMENARGVRAFYDFDTAATLTSFDAGSRAQDGALTQAQIAEFDLYLSLAGGSLLDRMAARFNTTCARSLHCSYDPAWHTPADAPKQWELGYVASDAPDERAAVDRYMLEVARQMPDRRFVVAGSIYDDNGHWPGNVHRIAPVAYTQQRSFFAQQRFALNVTAGEAASHTPHSRLFQAAACGTAIITDHWSGLDRFFEPGSEVLVANSPDDVLRHLAEVPDSTRKSLSGRARRRLLREHTPRHRAESLETYVEELARGRQERAS